MNNFLCTIDDFVMRPQVKTYDCSTACFSAIINHHYKIHVSSLELYDQGCFNLQSKEEGLRREDVLNLSKNYSFSVFDTDKGNFDLIKYFIFHGHPVLIDFMSPRHDPIVDTNEDGGHYSVIIGVKDNGLVKKVKLADPGWEDHTEFGLYYWLDYMFFEKLWQSNFFDASTQNVCSDRWMAVFSKK